jgi:serine phosphatase RsbU (regulator of sigma subunit)
MTASPVPAIGGPPIGVLPGWKYTEQAVVLEPAGLLIGYTDGLIERRDQDIDDSFLALLTAMNQLPDHVRADVDALADSLLEMSPRTGSADDVAVVVLAFDPHPHVDPLSPNGRRHLDLRDIAVPPDRWA